MQDRIEDLKQAKKESADTSAQCADTSAQCAEQAATPVIAVPESLPAAERNSFEVAVEHGRRAGWLSPIPLQPKRQAVRAKKTERRASNKGFLSLGVGEYLQSAMGAMHLSLQSQ